MKLVSFTKGEGAAVGILEGELVTTLDAASMIDLISAGGAHAFRRGDTIPLAEVSLLPPVVRPGKVIALGRNYAAHAAEGGAEPPAFPMLFHKTHTSLVGHGQPIVLPDPALDSKIDYEAELAVVIGKACKQVSEAEALDYVFGYSVANDVSARGLQRRTSQFSAGKMLDTFGPLGPTIVTADEIIDVQDLQIRTVLNGSEMQNSNTSYMIFSVAFTISYISQISTLEPGDVILTGTPEGVGYARTPPVYLKDGDSITIEVQGVGSLTNPVVAAA